MTDVIHGMDTPTTAWNLSGASADPCKPAKTALSVRALTVSYGVRPVLRSVSFDVPKGKLLGIVGPNGAGKSTLLKAMLGLIDPNGGWIRIFNHPIAQCRDKVAYVPQTEAVDWDFPVTVFDVVLMGRYGRLGMWGRPKPDDRRAALDALVQVSMEDYLHRHIRQLSGGQQKRVFLARALCQQAEILLLDEPFAGVDAATEHAIFELMDRLTSEGKTLIVVNHDLSVLNRFDLVLLLNQQVVAFGPTETTVTDANLRRTYGGRLTLLDRARRGPWAGPERQLMEFLAGLEFDWSQALVPFGWRWKEETLCSVLVGIACGALGCFVVLRRMALIGDALSHAILPGVVLAFLITQSTDISKLFLGALAAGVIAAVLIRVVSQTSRTKEDSAIGIVFTALFATGIILASNLPRGTHFDLKCFLFGDPLAVGRDDLIMMGIIAPLVLLTIFLFYHRLKLISFDPTVAAAMGVSVTAMHYLLMGLLSATVVAGLKTTGVVLVVAMVITPASAAYQLCDRLWSMLILAGIFGAISAAAGMSLAFVTNSPTGPAMVLVATGIFGLSMILSPKHGLLLQALRRRRVKRHIDGEDVIKAIFRRAETGEVVLLSDVVRATGLTPRQVHSTLGTLGREGIVAPGRTPLLLTDTGRRRATELVRAHRLWESYLADEAKIPLETIHEEAERLEHVHELADELDVSLGFPTHDPHGEAIPLPDDHAVQDTRPKNVKQ